MSSCRASIESVKARTTSADRCALLTRYESADTSAARDDCRCPCFAPKLRFFATSLAVG
jgi:hypothetical protein